MDKGVVEGGIDSGDAKDELVGAGLGGDGDVLLSFDFSSFLRKELALWNGWIPEPWERRVKQVWI